MSALFTRTSMPPKRSSACFTAAALSSGRGHVQRQGQSGVRVMRDEIAHRTQGSRAQHSAVSLLQYILGESKPEATGCSRYEPCLLRIDGQLPVCLNTPPPFGSGRRSESYIWKGYGSIDVGRET